MEHVTWTKIKLGASAMPALMEHRAKLVTLKTFIESSSQNIQKKASYESIVRFRRLAQYIICGTLFHYVTK